MFSHWQYVLGELFGPVRSLSCSAAIHLPERVDERGQRYRATAEDAAYATLQLANGIVAQVNSSWCVRVYRDELLSVQVDGTLGSAVAGLRQCRTQSRANTPKPVWNPDLPQAEAFREHWAEVPDNDTFDNAFKVQWEMFLRHVAAGTPFPWDFLEAARGVQLTELAYQSWRDRCWVDVPDLVL
jgi:predicted dehydrogenase